MRQSYITEFKKALGEYAFENIIQERQKIEQMREDIDEVTNLLNVLQNPDIMIENN